MFCRLVRLWRGTQALVLDPFGGLCAPGVPGELCLAGAQLSAGYAGRPGQTAQAFTAHPERAGARLYRTGDLVAWRGDGRLTYLGRIDSQIKIRGMRVELDEISTALGALPGVGSAVALMQDKTLVALFTRAGAAAEAEGGSGPALVDLSVADHDALTAGLAARLPAHMIPAAVAEVTYLPVTASGKIDLRALPEVTAQQVPFAAPEGEIERAIAGEIAALIAQETGTPPPAISRHDSFFGLGGHSLMAVRLTARLAQATGTQIPLRSLFEAGTIKDIAVAIAAQAKTAALPPLRKAADDAPIPLSYAQERLWFVERFAAPGTIAEVLGLILRVFWMRRVCGRVLRPFTGVMTLCGCGFMWRMAFPCSALARLRICPMRPMICGVRMRPRKRPGSRRVGVCLLTLRRAPSGLILCKPVMRPIR